MPKLKKNDRIVFVCEGHSYDLKRGRIVAVYNDIYTIKLDGVADVFSATDTNIRRA